MKVAAINDGQFLQAGSQEFNAVSLVGLALELPDGLRTISLSPCTGWEPCT